MVYNLLTAEYAATIYIFLFYYFSCVAENVIGKTEVLAYLTINTASSYKPTLVHMAVVGLVWFAKEKALGEVFQ